MFNVEVNRIKQLTNGKRFYLSKCSICMSLFMAIGFGRKCSAIILYVLIYTKFFKKLPVYMNVIDVKLD